MLNIIDTLIFEIMILIVMKNFKTTVYFRTYVSNGWVIKFLFFYIIKFDFIHLLVTK